MELKNKIESSNVYLDDRHEYVNSHSFWHIERSRGFFEEKFLNEFHKDIEMFRERFPSSETEMVNKFVEEYFYYREILGEEWIIKILNRAKR